MMDSTEAGGQEIFQEELAAFMLLYTISAVINLTSIISLSLMFLMQCNQFEEVSPEEKGAW